MDIYAVRRWFNTQIWDNGARCWERGISSRMRTQPTKIDGSVKGAVTFFEYMAIFGISWYFWLNFIKSQGCKLFFLGNITLRKVRFPSEIYVSSWPQIGVKREISLRLQICQKNPGLGPPLFLWPGDGDFETIKSYDFSGGVFPPGWWTKAHFITWNQAILAFFWEWKPGSCGFLLPGIFCAKLIHKTEFTNVKWLENPAWTTATFGACSDRYKWSFLIPTTGVVVTLWLQRS